MTPEETQLIVVMAPHNVYGAINLATVDDELKMILHRPINLPAVTMYIYPIEEDEE